MTHCAVCPHLSIALYFFPYTPHLVYVRSSRHTLNKQFGENVYVYVRPTWRGKKAHQQFRPCPSTQTFFFFFSRAFHAAQHAAPTRLMTLNLLFQLLFIYSDLNPLSARSTPAAFSTNPVDELPRLC